MRRLAIFIFIGAVASSSCFAKGGLLNLSVEQVSSILGQPSRHDHGKISGIEYERYYFETKGWKTDVLFIEGKAQKFETEKSDGTPLSDGEKNAICDGYDLPNTPQNAKLRGWRALNENHLIRGDGRVHVIKRPSSMTVFLDDLPRDFW